MNSTCLFIYNPISGKGKIEKNKEYILNELSKKFEKVTLYATQFSGEVTQKILEVENQYSTIVIAGGDGTFNEMTNAVARLQNKPHIGYIPAGTVNDVARSLGISNNIKRALKIICSGRVEYLDCMKIQEKYAMYVIATGAFTHTAYVTPQKIKKRYGKFAYAIEAFKTNINFQTFAIETEHKKVIEEENMDKLEMHSVFVIVMNGKYVAGRPINKKGSMLDGQIEVAIIQQCEKPNFWQKIAAFFRLIHFFIWGYYVPTKSIKRLQGKEFFIKTSKDIVWSYDGEKGDEGSIHVTVEPKAIPLLIPIKRKKI